MKAEDRLQLIKKAINGKIELDLPQMRLWLEEEIKQAPSAWGAPIPLKALAFLLYRNGAVEDAPLIWRAKLSNFDCFAILDIELVAGAGPEETIAYLEGQDLQSLPIVERDEQEQTILSYMKACLRCEDFYRREPWYIESMEEEIRELLEELERDLKPLPFWKKIFRRFR
jgi:hypothetical protein